MAEWGFKPVLTTATLQHSFNLVTPLDILAHNRNGLPCSMLNRDAGPCAKTTRVSHSGAAGVPHGTLVFSGEGMDLSALKTIA